MTGMLESMEKRASPVSAHKVATKYFDDFRKERRIAPVEQVKESNTAVAIGIPNAVATAVDSAVADREKKRTDWEALAGKRKDWVEDPLLSRSENKVYGAMYGECVRRKSDTLRLGLKELKGKTGLSDKTIRVSIHALEKKKNIAVVESSLGIYGRKFRISSPEKVLEERKREGTEIDPTTKKVQNIVPR